MRFYTPVLAVLALVFGMSQVGHCAAAASVLSIVSPLNQVVYSSDPPLVTIGDAGRVMIVYKAKVGQGKFQPVSAFGGVGNWTQGTLVIPPEVTSYPESLNFRDIAFDASSHGFDLAGTHYGKLFYWQWKGGNWTAPNLVASSLPGVAGIGVVRRTGRPAEIVGAGTVFQYYRKSGADWQLTKLPFTVAQRSLDPVYTAGGSLYLVGLHKGVPLVATLPPKADATQTDKWALKPPGEATGWSAPFSAAAYDLDVVLDCPHQLLYATWRDGNEVRVAWAPVGATQASQWGQAIVPVPDKAVGVRACLRSNGRGGVGLLATYMVKAEPGLKLHWLSGAGLGAEIPLLRPGTATEASVFQSIPGDAMNFAVDAQGTAHVAIVASKRGEVPSGVKRLYHATVTGGGTSTADPETGGSGTTEMELEGPKPDFMVRVVEPAATDAPLHVAQGTSLTSARLRPQIEITNQGAQYFGDLVFVANVDGATVRIRVPDETNHRQPLFLRGQKRLYYLPQFTWEYKYQANMPAHSLSYDYKPEDRSFPMYTGLGRKLITVTVDPDGNIPEADEKNNVGKADFAVADGYPVTDRGRINNQFVYGLNDVGLAQPPVLRSNTRILKAGYVQRPTQLDVVVGNMSGGGFYLDTPVVVTLDGKELYRQSVPLMTREPNLRSAYLGKTIIYERPPPKPDLCGFLLRVPVDLTAVAEGDHVLRVAVDPNDKFADRKRDNNTAEVRFKVRSPGGKLRVHVQEYNAPNRPVARATVVLGTLWADFANQQGLVEIEDVPRGSYDGKMLWADRNDPEPVYFASYAPAFTVADNEVKDITIRCERAMNIVGDVRVAGTGRFLDDDYIEAFVLDANDLFVQGGSTGHRYRIENVPPGQHRIICGAYGFQTKETTAQIRRASPTTDDCTVNIELVDGPRATVTGKVVDLASNKPLADATVWLQGAPRAVATAADGSFALQRVAAGQGYTVWAQADAHSTESAETGALAGGQTKDVGIIKLGAITAKFTSIDFDATTWAICEESADTGATDAFKVDTSFGAFNGALGFMYHTTAGQPDITADNIIVWLQGGDFIQGGVSTSVGLESFTGVDMDTLSVGIMGEVLGGVGKGFKILDGVNKLAEYLGGPVDPNMLHRNNKVVANYTSQTGAEYKQDPLIDIPLSTDIPLAMTFRGGGSTIVRVDDIIISDARGRSKTIHAEWYSPGYSVFRINSPFDLNTVEVKLNVAVLNERLQSGVLGTASQNQIHWKPMQSRWLRVSGFRYQ